MKNLIASVCAGLALLFTGSAFAATTGTVKGKIQFYQNQYGGCPSAQADCSDWNYREKDHYQKAQPIPEVKLVILDDQDTQIGAGVTGLDGSFSIKWTSANNRTSGKVNWHGHHKDGRFALQTMDGERWVFSSSVKSLTANGTKDWGAMNWGSAASPNKLTTLYEGAWRTWYHSFRRSPLLEANFTNVVVSAWTSSAAGASCPTSCAGSAGVAIDDAPTTYRSYSSRIAHELGHVASSRLNRGSDSRSCVDYTRDGDTGWNFTSPEHTCASSEEALATFLGDVSRMYRGALNPFTCAGSNCGFPLETAPVCGTNVGRHALSQMRYLWDIYDTREDGETVTNIMETLAQTVNDFPIDAGNHGRDEAWDRTGAGAVIDHKDGRDLFDFRRHLFSRTSVSTAVAYDNNCLCTESNCGNWVDNPQ